MGIFFILQGNMNMLKGLIILITATFILACQSEEASASYGAEEVILEYVKNPYRAAKMFDDHVTVNMKFSTMTERGNDVAIVGFYYSIDAWFGCIAPTGTVPTEWVNLSMGDTATVTGRHAGYEWKEGSLGVLFQQCEPLNSI